MCVCALEKEREREKKTKMKVKKWEKRIVKKMNKEFFLLLVF